MTNPEIMNIPNVQNMVSPNQKSLEKWLILDVRQEIYKKSLHHFAFCSTSNKKLWRSLESHPNRPGIIFKMIPVFNNMSTNIDNNGNMLKDTCLMSCLMILKNKTKLYLQLEHWRILVNPPIISKIVKSLASSIYLVFPVMNCSSGLSKNRWKAISFIEIFQLINEEWAIKQNVNVVCFAVLNDPQI